MGVVDDLRQARETFERGDWITAFGAWSDVDPDALGPDDLLRLATAAVLLGKHDACVSALQRAFQAHADRGELAAAARCGFWLSMVFALNEEAALAAGWTARADRLLDELGEDVVERGYLQFLHMFEAMAAQDFPGAFEKAAEATEHGRRFADPDLLALGLAAEGRMTIYSGHVPEGLGLLDEAMVGVAAGDVSPVIAGNVYCVMIEGCQEISDLGRAAENRHGCGRRPAPDD
jgi:hypothetical protein